MKLSIIKNLAVAALLSTTLMSGVMATEITETDLEPTGKVGAALAPLLKRTEAAALKAEVEDALTKHHSLFSVKDPTELLAAIVKYEQALQQAEDDGDTNISDNMLSMAGLKLADIGKLLEGKTAAQIEQEKLDAHWNTFLTSDHGKHLAAKKDAELRFGSVSGQKASAVLSAKPGTLAEAQKFTQEAHDYYDAKAALPRTIGEVKSLRAQLSSASISAVDVDTAITTAGFPAGVLKKLSATDGKARLGEALVELKRQKDQVAGLLKANTSEMDSLRSQIEAAKLLKASGGGTGHTGFTPPPSRSGSPTSHHKTSSYNPSEFDGFPLLTFADFNGLDANQQAEFRAAFDSWDHDKQTAYKTMAEPTRSPTPPTGSRPIHSAVHASDLHSQGLISLDQMDNWQSSTY